jgi:CO dehydrogenase/acetyl-CoA synthase delta subunit
MCGIFGIVLKEETQLGPTLIEAGRRLSYRGYDSVGCAAIAEIDNALLVPIAEATKGERLVLGNCEDKNYRTIVATAMANDHLVVARSPMDVNLPKQLNILINDMGFPPDRIS